MDEPRDKPLFSIWFLKIWEGLIKIHLMFCIWLWTSSCSRTPNCLLRSVLPSSIWFCWNSSFPFHIVSYCLKGPQVSAPIYRLLRLSLPHVTETWHICARFFGTFIQAHALFSWPDSRIPCPSSSLNFSIVQIVTLFLSCLISESYVSQAWCSTSRCWSYN